MRIGLSTNTLQLVGGKREPDGIGVYTAMLLQGLVAVGQHVVAISDKSLSANVTSEAYTQQYFSWPFAFSGLITTMLGVATPGQERVGKLIDLYHCTDYHQPRLRKTPIVTTLHDAIFLQNPAWCRQNWRQLKNWVIRQSARRAQHVICVSQAAKQDVMEHFGIPEARISVIYHGVDSYWLERVSEIEKQQVLAHFQLKPNYFLFIGTIQPRKNVGRLLQAYQLLPESLRKQHQLVIVGKAAWDEPALTALRRLSNNGVVKWLGYVSRTQLRCLYQASRLFVFPSLYEGFGLPVLEAFASGVPVVSANRSALPEICGEDAALLVDPENPDAIAVAMRRVLTDDLLYAKLASRGIERAAQFSWSRCVAETLAVYRGLLG